MSAMRDVNLPADLCALAEDRFRGRFQTLEALLTFVLQELLREDKSYTDEAEQKIVEQRLRDLGYL